MRGYAWDVLECDGVCGESVAYCVYVCSFTFYSLWEARCQLVIRLFVEGVEVSMNDHISVWLENSKKLSYCPQPFGEVEVVQCDKNFL